MRVRYELDSGDVRNLPDEEIKAILREWKGMQIIPKDYIKKATSALRPSFTESDPNWTAGYGYITFGKMPPSIESVSWSWFKRALLCCIT